MSQLLLLREGLLEARAPTLQSPTEVRVRGFVRYGAPTPTILELAESSGHDLIVMGTHGRTGVSHLLMGSVAEKVIRHATCPVLVVPGARLQSRLRHNTDTGDNYTSDTSDNYASDTYAADAAYAGANCNRRAG